MTYPQDFINKVLQGDCLQGMKTLPDNSVDAIVTDPPYGLSFMGKKWDYDVPSQEIWEEALRVLKPGGYLLAFAGTRTQHRMAVRIEDAGFEIRDMIAWVYGSGFPKSLNIGKTMDKFLKTGNASWNGTGDSSNGALGYSKLQHEQGYRPADYSNKHQNKDTITENESKKWEGWGTALKPALEPITVARKPLSEKSVAENVLKWGTGGIDIDGCRVEIGEEKIPRLNIAYERKGDNNFGGGKNKRQGTTTGEESSGRFPANLIHDGSDEVVDLFPQNKGAFAPVKSGQKGFGGEIYGKYAQAGDDGATFYGDGLGSAARFFYCAKASKAERNRGLENLEDKSIGVKGNGLGRICETCGVSQLKPELCSCEVKSWINPSVKNFHPTVKPIALMEYLVKLVSREGAVVLDPFAGSGSTGVACQNLKREFIGCEMNEDYIPIIKGRLGNPEIIKVGGEVKETKPIKVEIKKGLSNCCQAEISKGYCVACCEKL